jgi:hypothetical protein
MPRDQRLIDRYFDRLERILERSEAAEKAARNERLAQWRAQNDKLKPPDEDQSNTEDDEPKH